MMQRIKARAAADETTMHRMREAEARVQRSLEGMREHRTVPAQCKLSPTESAALDAFVKQFHAAGITGATRSSVIRALILQGLREFA